MNNKITARQIKDNAKRMHVNLALHLGVHFTCNRFFYALMEKVHLFFLQETVRCFLTVCDYKSCDAYCFMWPESEGRRGSCEVATCLFKYIEMQRH